MPDLPPAPETASNAAFRREFYKLWGRENWIVCGSARRAEYAQHRQTLSIKSVRRGREHYYVDRRRLTVTDETWLVLNEGREYGSVLEAPRGAFSFCIFFRPGLAPAVAASRRLTVAEALDAGDDVPGAPIEFAENLRLHDKSVTPVLNFIRRHVELGVTDPAWYEEQFVFLLERTFQNERAAARRPERLECVRAAHRKELVKRIGWATDFMHSNLQRPLTLDELAQAARLSSFHFLRVFRQLHGVTPMSYLRSQRTARALALLASTDLTVSEVAEQVGLTRISLWRCMRDATGAGPARQRRREGGQS